MCYHADRLKFVKEIQYGPSAVSILYTYTVCLQMNGAVSKVNKKFISHLTRAKRTPSAAATVQEQHEFLARFRKDATCMVHCYCTAAL